MSGSARPDSRLGILLSLVLLAGCAGVPGTPCTPSFPYADGWLGGDAAYSIPLGARSVWLFGDSFVGRPDQVDRVGAAFVHNSIAISHCGPAGFEIDYAWGRDAAGGAAAFLRAAGSDPDQHWWWLFDGFAHAGHLYLGLLEVERSAPRGPLALPFRSVGMRLARIENPEADPSAWRATSLPLWTSTEAIPGSALVVHDGWLYLFTFLPRADGGSPRGLARLPLAALDAAAPDLPRALEYLAQDGRWKPGLDAADARLLMADAATEMSVRWHQRLERWLAVYSHPSVPQILARTAPELTGPWSDPVPLLRPPELEAWRPGHDPDTSCYAAKEHEQFARLGTLTLTYVCNLFARPGEDPHAVLERLQRDMTLYRPRVVTLPLPDALRLPGH